MYIFSTAPCVPLGLDTCCNINFDPLASIKWLFSVPRCCVLPEDMVSGPAMHGKPVALSRGATSKEGDDGGPLQQHKWSICTDSPCTDSALQGPSLRSPTPPSKVLALTWQCDIWLHFAYGV